MALCSNFLSLIGRGVFKASPALTQKQQFPSQLYNVTASDALACPTSTRPTLLEGANFFLRNFWHLCYTATTASTSFLVQTRDIPFRSLSFSFSYPIWNLG